MFTPLSSTNSNKGVGGNKEILRIMKLNLKSNSIKTIKQSYTAPKIECVELDNEISLQLESMPPHAPGETKINVPEYFHADPFKTLLG